MTSFVTNAGAAHVLAVLFGRSEIALPNYFIALCRKVPNIGDNGASIMEPDANQGYRRAIMPNFSTSWTLSGYNEAVNAEDIIWPVVTGDWGNLIAFGLLDAGDVGAGRLLIGGIINPPLQPKQKTTLRVRAGQLVINATSMTPSYQPT